MSGAFHPLTSTPSCPTEEKFSERG